MEETVKIIALLPPEKDESHRNISDEEYITRAKIEGKILTLQEFEKLWNSDVIVVSAWFIRVLDVTKSSFRLV